VDDFVRGSDLERRFTQRLSTRTEPFPHGVAYLDEEFPERYVSNFLWVDRGLDRVGPEELFEASDRILGGAGFEHRAVLIPSDAHGERLAPAFERRGYRTERNVTMLHRRRPDREPAMAVEELTFAEARPVILETYRREPDLPADTAARFADQHGKYERELGTRFFAGRVDGELAGVCELWIDGTDALVEHVDTLEEHRGHGVARSVVTRAIHEARVAGAEAVFIVADEDDWPKVLYERLGFDRLGLSWMFIRWPIRA
jgi:GNAT superfamily N-acetyltransferase